MAWRGGSSHLWLSCFAAVKAELSPETQHALSSLPPGSGHRTKIGPSPEWQQELERYRRRLDAAATWAFSALRWRHAIQGGPPRLESGISKMRVAVHDSLEDALGTAVGSYVPVPYRHDWRFVEATIRTTSSKDLSDVLGGSVRTYGLLPHEVLRQARDQVASSPRMAFLLAVVAAEAGLKRCLFELEPRIRWFIETGPTPPPMSLLKRYLPTCEGRCNFGGRTLAPPKASGVPAVLDSAFRRRNSLAHTGGTDVLDPRELAQLFAAVQDLLYLLDYYLGFEWALDHIRPATRAALEEAAV